jgi:uridine phosphorylase
VTSGLVGDNRAGDGDDDGEPTPRAWYLGCGPEDVGERAVLVGDRGRVRLAAELLTDPHWLNTERGLATVTGTRDGQRITVSAFGMGAPVAAIVLHELASIGVRSFVRLGTALTLPPARLGDLVMAEGAVRGESTSRTYLPLEFPALPDPMLTAALRTEAEQVGRSCVSGLIASYDGFYTQMFGGAIPGDGAEQPAPGGRPGGAAGALLGRPMGGLAGMTPRFDELARLGVVGVDMETSALFVVARALGVRAASLCLGSVDGLSRDRLGPDERHAGERDLLEIGLRGLLEAG